MKQNILLYNGSQYYISVKIFAPNSKVDYDNISTDQFDILQYDNIKKIEFEHDLSNSLPFGEIIYSDNSDSVLNKFLDKSSVYLSIDIKKIKNTTTASTNEVLEVLTAFQHTFIVTSIDKTYQKDDIIEYKLQYISAYWWNFNSNISYSTHNNTLNSRISPIDILTILYGKCGIPLDRNNIATKNLVDFMSCANETLVSAQEYLLKRTFDLNFLNNPGYIKTIYDPIADKFKLWALNQHAGTIYKNNIYKNFTQEEVIRNTITVPIYNKYVDSIQNQNPTEFDIINFCPDKLQYKLFSDYTYWTYDYNKNIFSKQFITNKNTIESLPYLPNTPLISDKKYYEIDTMLSKKNYKGSRNFSRQSSHWDQTHWTYEDIDNMLLNNGIVRIITAGELLRKPGDNTFLNIDNTDYSSIAGLAGDWINTRVVHTFGQKSYTNTILLTRVDISTQDRNTFLKKLK